MAIHFAPMGTNGADFGPTQHSWVESYMENTAIDLYLSYGVRTASTQADYLSWVNSVLNNTIGDSPIKLIVDIWEAALNDLGGPSPDYTKIDAVYNAFAAHSKVGSFFIEEPNLNNRWPHDTVVNRAKTRLGGAKPLIVDIYPGSATQTTYNNYASYCDYLSGFRYPHPAGSWTNIESIADNNTAMYFMKNASCSKPFYFCVEVKDGAYTMPSEAEVNWMTHRALTYGATGIFFYSWARRWEKGAGDATAVRNVCSRIKNASVHLVLSDNSPLSSGVTFNSGGSSVLYGYYSYSGHHYLFVLDKSPGSGSYPKTFDVECEVSSQEYTNFELVLERLWGGEVGGASKEAPSSIRWSGSIASAGGTVFYDIVSIT